MSQWPRFLKEHWPRLLFSAGVAAVFFGNQGFRSLAGNWLELRRLRRELSALEAEQSQLEGRLKAMRAGDLSLERMARRELGFIKKDEIEYRFPPPDPSRKAN
ncbi:MAG: septum formation initiator family protein [Elusimicrobia bacterium]|nr:septum formation initiator family protein [Elusimicrobiota bacterium]